MNKYTSKNGFLETEKTNNYVPYLLFYTQNGKNAKVVPTLEYGFLHQIYTYLRNRIPTLSEFCVVCDEQHIFQNGAMLKVSTIYIH